MEELEDLLRELAQKSDRLAHVQTELAERESSLDEREAFIAAYLARLEHSHQEAEGRYQYAERRLAVLQDESEHLARALLPDDEPATPSLERAA